MNKILTSMIPMRMIPLHLLLPGCLLLAAGASQAAEDSPVQALEPIQVTEPAPIVRLVFDCNARTLPSQRLVGEALGQHNFSQVYDSRARLMAEVGRACQRPGIERVGLVMAADPSRPRPPDRRVARQDRPAR